MASGAAKLLQVGTGVLASVAAVGYCCGGTAGPSPREPVRTEECSRRPCSTLCGWDVVVRNTYYKVSPPLTESSGWRWFQRLFADHWREPPAVPSCTRRVVADTKAEASVPVLLASDTWPTGTEKFSALVLEPSRSSSERPLLQQWSDAATDQTVVRCDPLCRDTKRNCQQTGTTLEAPYLQTMMSALAWLPPRPPPLHVAVLGAGGGALPCFLQRYFGRVMERMVLVDVEPACFEAAVSDLGLGEVLGLQSDGDAALLFAMDAAAFLRQWRSRRGGVRATPLYDDPLARVHSSLPPSLVHRNPFDLLFVDLFTGSSLSPSVMQRDFVELCRSNLSSHGVAAFNLPQRSNEFEQVVASVFGAAAVFQIPVSCTANCVVVACNGRTSAVSHRLLWHRASELGRQFQLPFALEKQFPPSWKYW